MNSRIFFSFNPPQKHLSLFSSLLFHSFIYFIARLRRIFIRIIKYTYLYIRFILMKCLLSQIKLCMNIGKIYQRSRIKVATQRGWIKNNKHLSIKFFPEKINKKKKKKKNERKRLKEHIWKCILEDPLLTLPDTLKIVIVIIM